MSQSRVTDLFVAASNASPKGIDVSMPVACPNCKRPGSVTLENLGHLLYCRHCADKFWLGRNGQWKSAQKSAQAQVHCPRCQAVNEYPIGLGLASVPCATCRFEVPLETPEPPQAAPPPKSQRPAKSESAQPFNFTFSWHPNHAWWAVGAAVFLLVAGWWLLAPRVDPRLAMSVKTQVAALLDGDIAAAEEAVLAEQKSEFQRWLKVDFSPRLERKSISNPTFVLDMNVLDFESTRVSVTLQTAKAKPIQFVQIWKRASDGNWKFAPAETRRHLEAAWAEEWKHADYSK